MLPVCHYPQAATLVLPFRENRSLFRGHGGLRHMVLHRQVVSVCLMLRRMIHAFFAKEHLGV
jgi:hypothetical protein